MIIKSIYLDSHLYKDSISIDNIILMCGYLHHLIIKTNPNVEINDLLLTSSDNSIHIEINKMDIFIDLRNINAIKDFSLYLNSKNYGINNYEFKVLLIKKIEEITIIGTYQNIKNKKQLITLNSNNKGSIDCHDLSDDLPIINFTWKFNPYSLEVEYKCDTFLDSDETLFTLYLTSKINKNNSSLLVNLCLEACNNNISDQYYLIGDGDEDGISDYDEFIKIK